MKRKLSFILSAVLLCALLLALPLSPEVSADIAASGEGEAVAWVITDGGALIIGPGTFPSAARSAGDYGWNPYRGSITSVSFTGGVSASGSLAEMFAGCGNLRSVSLSGLSVSAGTDLSRMFAGCSSLTQLDLSALDLQSCPAAGIFNGMSSLEHLTLGSYSLVSTGFDSLGHLWGLSDDSYQSAQQPGDILASYPTGTGRSFERVFLVNYGLNGGSPASAFSIVRISSAAAYPLLDPSAIAGYAAPLDMQFKYWRQGGTNYPAGTAANLRSFGTDTVTFTAAWRRIADWVWAPDGSYATATLRGTTLSRTDHNPVVISPDSSTCTADGQIGKRATAVFDDDVYTDDHSFPVAAHHTLEHHDATAALCTVNGNVEYWHCTRGCNQNFSSAAADTALSTVVIPALGHDWGAPGYSWAENNGSVTARRVCARDAGHFETETKASTYAVTTDPTCETVGVGTYTAGFANTAFAPQTKNVPVAALGHIWGAPSYSWAADNSSTTASRVCTRDAGHVDSETVHPAVESYLPTCLTSGMIRYTSDFTKPYFVTQVKTLYEPAATGHALERHLLKEPTCTEAGSIEYWVCRNCGEFFADSAGAREIPDHSSVLTPALGHDFPETWNADARGHWRICRRCGVATAIQAHRWNHPPTVEEGARCVVCGYLIAPALRIQAHAYFGASGDMGLGRITYTKQKVAEDDWIVQIAAAAPKEDGYYFEGWLASSDNELHPKSDELPFTYAERRAVIVRGVWTEIIGEGEHELEGGTRYRFDEGSFKLSGDETVYAGDRTFYPSDDASAEVKKAG